MLKKRLNIENQLYMFQIFGIIVTAVLCLVLTISVTLTRNNRQQERQLLDECDVAHITKIDYEYEADAYFPNLDENPEWEITADSDEQTYFDLEYYFYKYEKRRRV